MRYLAIDLGGKRTGLAVGSDVTGVVTPIGMIEASHDEGRLSGILDATDEHGPDEFVLGLPLNMDDSEGPAAKQARLFAAALAERTGLPVHLWDERLTSQAADEQMSRSGLTHSQKKARRDALAAAALLRDFLTHAES